MTSDDAALRVGSLDHDDPVDLRFAYEEYPSIKAAAERFEVSYFTVFTRMEEYGIHLPGTRDPDSVDDLERTYEFENGSVTAVAQHYDLDEAEVRARLVDAGIHDPEESPQATGHDNRSAAETDGGTASVAADPVSDLSINPSAGTSNRTQCENCGGHVSAEYARVFAPTGRDSVRVCPNCPDKLRDNGKIREARSSRRSPGGGS